jgi:hypothetical protein
MGSCFCFRAHFLCLRCIDTTSRKAEVSESGWSHLRHDGSQTEKSWRSAKPVARELT